MISFIILLISQAFAADSAVDLNGALSSALQKNEAVGQAREHVVQAQSRVDQAWSAPQPTVSLNALHMIQDKPAPQYRAFSPPDQTTVNLQVKQPLFHGFRELAGLHQTKDLLRSEKAKRLGTLSSLYEEVATSYYNVLALEQDLKNLEEQRKIYEARVKNLTSRTRRGESPRYDPPTAQATEAATEADIQLSKAQLKAARENFQVITGLPADTMLVDADAEKAASAKEAKAQKLDDYMARIDVRPDVIDAQELTKASENGVLMAKRAHWPSLDLIGNYYFVRPEGFMDEVDWDVQFMFTLPIYEGGLRKAQTREAVSKKLETDLALSRVRRQAEAEIKSLHENLLLRERQLAALKRASETSRQSSELVERDFRRGLAKNIDVQAALAQYSMNKRNYDQARFAARLDVVRLERAAQLMPPPIQDYARKEGL